MKTDSDNFRISDEHTDMRWFDSNELDDEKYDLSPSVIFYAKESISKAKMI